MSSNLPPLEEALRLNSEVSRAGVRKRGPRDENLYWVGCKDAFEHAVQVAAPYSAHMKAQDARIAELEEGHRVLSSANYEMGVEMERLRAENSNFVSQLNKWAEFSERHGWLDPEDFDRWIAGLKSQVAELESKERGLKETLRRSLEMNDAEKARADAAEAKLAALGENPIRRELVMRHLDVSEYESVDLTLNAILANREPGVAS